MTTVPTMHRVPYSWLALSIFLVEFVIMIRTSVIARARSDPSSFRHPTLTLDEMKFGCKLGIDS